MARTGSLPTEWLYLALKRRRSHSKKLLRKEHRFLCRPDILAGEKDRRHRSQRALRRYAF